MSYDIVFWKQPAGFAPPPAEVYDHLCDGKAVPGLEPLPIDEIVGGIAKAFSSWDRLDKENWEHPTEGAFSVSSSRQHLRVDCYGVGGEHINSMIDVAYDFGCSFYDPQVGQLFTRDAG